MRNSVAPVPVSSKVAQMASMFQSPESAPAPGPAPPVLVSAVPLRKPSADTGPAQPQPGHNGSELKRPQRTSVHRTESHHERFSSARALFERMGSGDNLLEEARSRSSLVTSPSGSRTSSISQRPSSRTDSESGVSSRHSLNNLRSRSSSPLGQESRSSSVSSTAQDGFKNGISHDYIRTSVNLSGQSSPNKQPPDKPERKINAREAISKQRNWFSNFEKSKTPESVDSARRTSVNKENKPSSISGGSPVNGEAGSPARVTLPLSPNHQTKSISPKTSDSIEAYMHNWKKSPTNSKSDLW